VFEVEGDHYIAVVTDGKGVIPSGTKFRVPNSKMKWDAGNPIGRGGAHAILNPAITLP